MDFVQKLNFFLWLFFTAIMSQKNTSGYFQKRSFFDILNRKQSF